MRKDKAGRKEEGLQVVRLGEKRTILTQLGELCYHRTYYRNTRTGEYIYPIDQIVGVSPYCRVEAGLGEQLVRESRQVSYQKAAEICIDNQVSRQTVLNKIRQAVPVLEEPQVKKQLAELHIDADEDHVAMQSPSQPRRKIVPLVSVYEGLEKAGARNRCKNVFHISP